MIQGNALNLPLRDQSIDLALCSPPYFAMREYGDSADEIGRPSTVTRFVDDLIAATAEMARVVKGDGSIFVNLQDRYVNRSRVRRSAHQPGMHARAEFGETWAEAAARGGVLTSQIAGSREKALALVPERFAVACADRLGLYVKSMIVWSKTHGMPDPTAHDRVPICHEYVVHLSRSATVRVGSLPTSSVWTLAPGSGSTHPAVWPRILAETIILGWSAPGDVVLDPFGGEGTTAAVCAEHGRVGVSLDLYRWPQVSAMPHPLVLWG